MSARLERYNVRRSRRNPDAAVADAEWVNARKGTLCDPFLASEAIAMLDSSYRGIGGNATFRSASDLCDDEYDAVELLLSGDRLRAVRISKTTPFGVKCVAIATDGSDLARASMKQKTMDWYRQPGQYGEVSGAIAALALKAKSPVVTDHATVERVLGKRVQWHGAHPDGEFPGTFGWYTRSIGGHPHVKILVGTPRVSRDNGRRSAPNGTAWSLDVRVVGARQTEPQPILGVRGETAAKRMASTILREVYRDGGREFREAYLSRVRPDGFVIVQWRRVNGRWILNL